MSDFKPDIWRLQAQFNTQGLVGALSNEDPGIRKRAAAALRALGAYNTIPDLQQAVERETDPEARSNMLSAIATLQKEKLTEETGKKLTLAQTEAERLIIELKKARDVDTVMRLAKSLGEVGDKQAVEPLVILFTNPKVPIKVRLAVAEALLKLESAPVEVTLLGALRSPEWRVRRNGAAILGQLRADWAVEPLTKALRDENEVVRRTALAALRHIGTPEARKAIEAVRQAVSKRKAAALSSTTPSGDTPKIAAQSPASEEKMPEIKWPSRKDETVTRTRMPTKPLDPRKLEQFIESKKPKKHGDTPEGEA